MDAGVAFEYKDYRVDGHARQKVMRLATDEFIRRFLIHVLPTGFHLIRHYGLFASGVRAHNIAHARELLAAPIPREQDKRPNDGDQPEPRVLARPCPVGMDLDMQIKLFETALDELDQNSDLINQVLEITLDDANDAEFTIIRYELPTLPFPFPEGAARRTPGSPVRAARAVTRCWGETFLGR